MIVPKGLLDGHIAVVTGGGSGIGRGTAHVLAEAGARVAVVDIDGAKARAVADEIGAAAKGYEVDVTDADACQALAGRVHIQIGPASILFNNAGIVRRAGAVLEHRAAGLGRHHGGQCARPVLHDPRLPGAAEGDEGPDRQHRLDPSPMSTRPTRSSIRPRRAR